MARFRDVGQGLGGLVWFFTGVFDGHSRVWFRLSENGLGKSRSHSLNVSIMRATDVAIDEIRALVCGHGDLGEGHVELIAECVLLCAVQACVESLLQEATFEDSVSELSIFISPGVL